MCADASSVIMRIDLPIVLPLAIDDMSAGSQSTKMTHRIPLESHGIGLDRV